MFKLLGVMNDLFAIQDTDDDVIDVLPKSKVCKCLNLGFEIGGITRISEDEFSYTDEFFPISEDTDEEEDEDYDYGDSYYDEEDSSDDDSTNDEDAYDDGFGDEDYGEDSSDEEYEEDDEDAFDDGFGDEDFGVEEQEVSTVNKLYSHLNDEQIKLLKRYYLWFSQRIFDEGKKKQRTLQVTNSPRKLQKQKELNVMRNQGGMWAYAGFIDMGYRGADYCTLGHPLRYVHLAWDISVSDIETSFFGEDYNNDIEKIINSNNCIKFGIDCISDFFEIDKEYTDRLKRAQREAIKDMDFMCQYYEDGVQDKVISSFTVMDEIEKHISLVDARGIMLKGEEYKCLIPRGLTSFYRQFRQLGMVVPKSLVQEMRDSLIGWDSHKFTGWKYPNWGTLSHVLEATLGKSCQDFVSKLRDYSYGYDDRVKDYLVDFFQLKSCGYYEYNADNFKEEGGASKPVKAQLYAIHNSVKRKFWSDKEYTFTYLKKLVELNNEFLRVDSVIDAFKTPSLCTEDYHCYIGDKDNDIEISILEGYADENCEGLSDWLNDLRYISRSKLRICMGNSRECIPLDDFLASLKEKLDKCLAEVDNYRSYALKKLQDLVDEKNETLAKEKREQEEREEQRRQEEEKRRQEEELERQRREKEKEESKEKQENCKLSDEEIRQYCIDNASKVKGDSKLKFALTVLDTVNKTGKCSDKQMYYISQIYTELTGVQIEDKRQYSKVSLDTRKDIEDAIDKVLADPDLLENEDNKDKVYAILTSIKKYRNISERQMKYAEIALKVVKED